ncbi:hypothetical protein [Helicobacter sp. MIT 01-3238]|uniref:hypothetical protein n=1 Tax=Helicobacter sp. MIT 01-3238 TaxID=398627 RepID=UPI0015F159A7|nr:hypothetical protein [Helicobacter sp. MIT 01-3238]
MPSKIAQKHAKSSIKSAPKPTPKDINSSDLDKDFASTQSSLESKNPTSTQSLSSAQKPSPAKTTKPPKPQDTPRSTKSTIQTLNQMSAKSFAQNLPQNLSQNLSNETRDTSPHGLTNLAAKLFANREDAFDKLYDMFVNQHIDSSQNIILSTSFDGLFFAHNLAHKLNSKLDLLFSAPIFAPMNDECEIASVSENMDIVLNEELIDSFDITLDYVYGEARRTYDEVLLPRIYKFRKGATLSDLSQKDVFLIDQGVESGITMSLAIKTCIQKKAKSIFVLAPVIARDVAELLKSQSDMLICVASIDYFVSTEHYYKELKSLSEEEVLKIMSAHTKADKAEKSKESI